MIFNKFYLDKRKLVVLFSVFFLLSSALWFEVKGQELDSSIEETISENTENDISENSVLSTEDEVIISEDNTESVSPATEEENIEVFEEIDNSSFIESDHLEPDLVPYVVYDNSGLKEIETEIEENREILISKEERIISDSEDYWGKEITVSSDEHFERPVKVYVDIAELNFESIELIWNNNNIDVTHDPSFNLEYYDLDGNGYNDRISFEVPHLSEQNFEIRLFYLTSNNSSTLELNSINTPSNIILSGNTLPFNFTLNYVNISSVYCDFKIMYGNNLKYSQNGLINLAYNINISSYSNGNYSWNLFCMDDNLHHINDSLFGSFEISLNHTPIIQFSSDSQSVISGQSVNFGLNLSTLNNRSLSYHIVFDGGYLLGPNSVNNLNYIFSRQFNLSGSYNVSLTVIDGSMIYNRIIPISVSNSPNSNIGPGISVELNSPSNNAIVSSDHVNFTYLPRSNVTISNCTFNLYYFNGSSLGSLVYEEVNYSISINSTDVVALHNFDDGDYSWEVECYNSESRKASSSRDFSFDKISNSTSFSSLLSINNSYERREDIDKLLSDIDDFLDKIDNFGFEEKEVVEILDLSEKLISYKRKLNQFRQDLSHNINFIQNDADKEKRKKEIYSEIDSILSNVPLNLEVIKQEEYVKNSIDSDMEEIVSRYISSENLIMGKKEIRNLAEYNKKLQDSLKISSKLRHVSIEYYDKKSEITLVTKSISSDSLNGEIFLEVLPGDIKLEDLFIINKNNYLKDNKTFYVTSSSLLDNKLIYYLNSFVSFEDIKISDTILFSEDTPTKINSFTGFSVLLGSGEISGFALYFSWAIFGFIVLLLFFVFSKNFVNLYNQSSDVKLVNRFIHDAKNSLIRKDVIRAKEDYIKVKKVYSYLSLKERKAVYGQIGKLLLEINRVEVSSLVEEYVDCVRSGRRGDSIAIYNKIRLLYDKFPDKYKEKIHQRLLPYLRYNL